MMNLGADSRYIREIYRCRESLHAWNLGAQSRDIPGIWVHNLMQLSYKAWGWKTYRVNTTD